MKFFFLYIHCINKKKCKVKKQANRSKKYKNEGVKSQLKMNKNQKNQARHVPNQNNKVKSFNFKRKVLVQISAKIY